ncbi:MAG: MATE family efflux transporter [Akkermansia sp.]
MPPIPNQNIGKFGEMKKIIPLAFPVVIANLTQVGLGCVDTIVAGKFSALDMASVALGTSIFVPIQLFACGILMVLGPIIANLRGRQNESRIGYVMSNGMWLVGILSVVILGLLFAAEHLLPWISNDPAMVKVAENYVFAVMWGVPANLMFVALKSLNEGTNMTRPAMFVGVAALIVNIPANYIFVFGMFGAPQMGGAGCGVATAIVYWFQAAVMLWLVYKNPSHRSYRQYLIRLAPPAKEMIKRVIKLGLPVGLSWFCEVMLFCAAALILAPLGYIAVGCHQVAANVASLLFMTPLSIGLAASIRVAYHTGRKDKRGIDSAIRSSYVLVLGIMVVTSIAILLYHKNIVMLYNEEPIIVSTASSLLLLGVIYQLPDCLQVVSVGILRGFRDTAAVSMITFFSYWIVGFPVCYVLARTDWVIEGLGAKGVWIGFIFGLTTAAILLIIRVIRTRKAELKKISA